MRGRLLLVVAVVIGAANAAITQGTATATGGDAPAWRSVGDRPVQAAGTPMAPSNSPDSTVRLATASETATTSEPAARALLHDTGGGVTLPNDAGQVWREYDISSYTARVTSTKRPEQAIIDWVLRETGYEAWHTEPLGVLCVNNRTLRVYHTPEMQKTVADIVQRFTSSEAASYTFSMRVVTLDSPNWRSDAQRLLRSVPVQTAGVNGWVLPKENAAILLGELRRRSDYREHSSPYLMVNNGQSTVISAMRGRPYVRDVIPRPDTAAGFDPSPGQLDEGFALDFSPLLSADRRLIDATIKCDIDQIEKMIPVLIDVPMPNAPRQRAKIESPQVVHYRFYERFRWPIDEVLVVGMGMVALPIPVDGAPQLAGLPLPIGNSPPRADLLVFVECKGQTAPTAAISHAPLREAKNYRGRY